MAEILENGFLVYPVTIIQDRYDGCYSQANWLAFLCEENVVPWQASGGDTDCSKFHHDIETGKKVTIMGKGDTPNEAYKDLVTTVKSAFNKKRLTTQQVYWISANGCVTSREYKQFMKDNPRRDNE